MIRHGSYAQLTLDAACGRKVRCIYAPKVGLVHFGEYADPIRLGDRVANGEAFPGEQIIRVPARVVLVAFDRWQRAVASRWSRSDPGAVS